MMNNKNFVLRIILMLLMLSLPLVLIVIYGTNGDWFDSQPGMVQAALIVALIALLVCVLLILFKSRFFLSMIGEAYERDLSRADKKSAINKEMFGTLTVNRAKYSGLTKKYTRLNWKTGIILILSILLPIAIISYVNKAFLALIIYLFFMLYPAYQYFCKFIVISPEGILYKTLLKHRFIKWSQIKIIGVSANISPFALVYISTRKAKTPQYFTARDVEEMVNFKFRSKMIHHILTYWEEEIVNLNNVRSWQRYIRSIPPV